MADYLLLGAYFILALAVSFMVARGAGAKWGLISIVLFFTLFLFLYGLLIFGCCSAILLVMLLIAAGMYKE
jgi:hypothetical protein